MQIPIMLCFKAKGIHTAPPGNPYNNLKAKEYINFTIEKKKKWATKKKGRMLKESF